MALKKAMVKIDVKWRPRNSCDGRLMVKIVIMTIPLGTLGATTSLLWGSHSLYNSLAVLDYVSLLFVFVYPNSRLLGFFNLTFLSLSQEDLTSFDVISNKYIYYMSIHQYRITCLQLISLLGELKCS